MLIEKIVLGFVQGLVEWLPLSSEGFILLIKTNFFSPDSVQNMIQLALFLHIGTFFAALIYFWKDVKNVFLSLLKYNDAGVETKKLLWYLVIATFITGVIGAIVMLTLKGIETNLEITGNIISVIIGLLLIVTGIILFVANKQGKREIKDLTTKDSIILGFLQGLAILPGISRSGITSAGLLLSNFSSENALKLSFILSLPIIILGNIALNFSASIITFENIIGVIIAFVVGLITIHIFLKIAKKINFGIFMIVFGLLVIFAVLIRFLFGV